MSTIGRKHWARYYNPGSFFSEDHAIELPDRSVDAAVAQAPAGAFAFRLYDTAVPDFEYDAGLFRVLPVPQDESAKHYLGGTIYTVPELRQLGEQEGDPDRYRVLIANITSGSLVEPVEGRAIRCRTGNWQQFEDGDVLVAMEEASI